MNEDNTISVVDPLFGFGGSKLLSLCAAEKPGRGLGALLRPAKPLRFDARSRRRGGGGYHDLERGGQHPDRPAAGPPRLATRSALSLDRKPGIGLGSPGSTGSRLSATDDRSIKSHIATGKGPSEIVFSEDSRSAFVLNRGSGTLSVIDVPTLRKVSDIPVGKKPAGLDYCAKSGSVFATDEESGQIVVVDARRRTVLATIKAEPGLGQIKFPPNGQFRFCGQPEGEPLCTSSTRLPIGSCRRAIWKRSLSRSVFPIASPISGIARPPPFS